MKRQFFSLLLMLCVLSVSAEMTFETGGLKYVNYSGTDVYCAGLAESASNVTDITVPATVTYGGTQYTVRRIGGSAFIGNTTLQSATIYCDVTQYAFSGCTALTSVTLKEGVKQISSYAFRNTNFKEITIPATTTSIDPTAFCPSALTRLTVDLDNPNYSSRSGTLLDKDEKTLVIVPTCWATTYYTLATFSFEAVGPYALYYTKNATDIELPYGVKSIGKMAFANSNVEWVKVPSSVESWGTEVFSNCSKLAELCINTLPFEINEYFLQNVPTTCKLYVRDDDSPYDGGPNHWKKFNYWKNLNIARGAYDLTANNLTMRPKLAYTVKSDDEVEVVYAMEKYGNVYREADSTKIRVPESINYRGKQYQVTSLGGHAFFENKNVLEIVLPTSITTFDEVGYTFSGCTRLQVVNIPSKVKRIPMYCFHNTMITQMRLPYGIEYIDMWAFHAPFIHELLIPSSVKAFDGSQLIGMEGLQVLILNTPFVVNITNSYIKSQLPNLSGLKTYVPYDLLSSYLNQSDSWFKAHGNVAVGAYDFANDFFFTVTKPYDKAIGYGECMFVSGTDSENVGRLYDVKFGGLYYTTSGSYKATAIQPYAFSCCNNLRNVRLDAPLTDIPEGAFYGTKELTSFPFQDPNCQLESIGKEAFADGGLTGDITLPETLTHLGNNVFANCPNLQQLTILSTQMEPSEYACYSGMSNSFHCYVDIGKYFDVRHLLLKANRKADEAKLLPFVCNPVGQWITLSQVYFWDGNDGLYEKPSISFQNIINKGGKLYEVAAQDIQVDNGIGQLELLEIDPKMGLGLPTETGLVAKVEPGRLYELSRIDEDTYIGSRSLLPTAMTLYEDPYCLPYPIDYGTDRDPYTYELDETADTPTFVKVTAKSRTNNPGHAYLSLRNAGISINDLPTKIILGSLEPYVELSNDSTTMTFYYDKLRYMRSGTTYGLNRCSIWSWGTLHRDWVLNPHSSSPDWGRDDRIGEVEHVVFDASFKDARPETTGYWFHNMARLTTITGMKENLNTSNVKCMDYMFSTCSSLKSVDVSGFKTGNVLTFKYMFEGCSSLESIDVSRFNLNQHVLSPDNDLFDIPGLMNCMFSGCSALKTIYDHDRDTQSWDEEFRPDGIGLFYGCTSLVGGAGTVYDKEHVGFDYFHIDGGPDNPGYLTLKIRGDVNGDGTVGIGDIVAITNVMAGIETNPDIIKRANVNGDESVGIGDIVAVTNIMAGI